MDKNFDNLQIPHQRNFADVVFCIDFSGSMTGVIDGLVKYIVDFVRQLNNNSDNPLDIRIGFIGHYYGYFFIKDFTTDTEEFKNALIGILTGGNEFTLPALDWAVDFNWKDKVHKIVILFTDECLPTGHDPDRQRSKMSELAEKIIKMHVKVFAYGPDECDEYREFFQGLPRCSYSGVDFYSIKVDDMKPVLEQIAKTVSASANGPGEQLPSNIEKDIYKVKEDTGFKFIRL